MTGLAPFLDAVDAEAKTRGKPFAPCVRCRGKEVRGVAVGKQFLIERLVSFIDRRSQHLVFMLCPVEECHPGHEERSVSIGGGHVVAHQSSGYGEAVGDAVVQVAEQQHPRVGLHYLKPA